MRNRLKNSKMGAASDATIAFTLGVLFDYLLLAALY